MQTRPLLSPVLSLTPSSFLLPILRVPFFCCAGRKRLNEAIYSVRVAYGMAFMSQKRAPILFNKPLRYLSSRGARKMENIADETVHVFNANDDITLHPSKDVNHAAGNANELRLRLQVQVMEIHYTSTPLPEQRRKEGADRASHYYTHALSLSLRNSDVRESALHQFCPNQLERKGRKEFLFGSASFSRAHPARCFSSIYLQFAFHVGRAGRSGIRNLFRLSLQRSSNCFPETSRPIWGRFLVGIARGGYRLRPLFSLISLSSFRSAFAASLSVTYEQTRRTLQ